MAEVGERGWRSERPGLGQRSIHVEPDRKHELLAGWAVPYLICHARERQRAGTGDEKRLFVAHCHCRAVASLGAAEWPSLVKADIAESLLE